MPKNYEPKRPKEEFGISKRFVRKPPRIRRISRETVQENVRKEVFRDLVKLEGLRSMIVSSLVNSLSERSKIKATKLQRRINIDPGAEEKLFSLLKKEGNLGVTNIPMFISLAKSIFKELELLEFKRRDIDPENHDELLGALLVDSILHRIRNLGASLFYEESYTSGGDVGLSQLLESLKGFSHRKLSEIFQDKTNVESVDGILIERELRNMAKDPAFGMCDIKVERAPSRFEISVCKLDRKTFKQIVLAEILKNAEKNKKSNQKKARVNIRFEPLQDGGVEICVRDFGKGMPPEKVDVLNSGQSGENISTTGGTGKGAFYNKKIVETLFEGGIRYASELGEWAEARIYFPPASKFK